MHIRSALVTDLPAITHIYNQAVLHTVATFDTEQKTLEQQTRWFEAHGERHPILVYELDGQVVGWASLNSYSERAAYECTAENSIYVLSGFQRRGIGKALLAALIAEGKNKGIHAIIAKITDGNAISIELHQKAGFFTVGVLREVGFKFGRRLDVTLMQWLGEAL